MLIECLFSFLLLLLLVLLPPIAHICEEEGRQAIGYGVRGIFVEIVLPHLLLSILFAVLTEFGYEKSNYH